MYWPLLTVGVALMVIGLWRQIPLRGNPHNSGKSRVYQRIAMLGMLVAGAWLTIIAIVHFMAHSRPVHP